MIQGYKSNGANHGHHFGAAVKTVAREMLPAAGGAVLGAPAAYLGSQLSDDLANYALRQGPRWVLQGSISPSTAVDLLPYLRDQSFVSTVGAVTLGLAGFALGAYLLWPRE